MHTMIEKADDSAKEVERKTLSFSISRILSNEDDKELRGSSGARAENVAEAAPRISHQHGATMQYYAPITETEANSRFECNVRPRACRTPEIEFPSPTSHEHPVIFRPFPVALGTYRPSPYTVSTRSYVGHQKYIARQDTAKTSAFYAFQNHRNVDDDDDENDSNRSTSEPEMNFGANILSDKSLDSLGESYHQSPSPFKSKKKKSRTVFSRNQIYQLEAAFDMNRYLTNAERAGLAASLKLSETQIKIWFQNRRNKWKRQINGEMDEIQIPPAFATSFMQNSLGQSNLNGLCHEHGSRADLVRSGVSLPAHINPSSVIRESSVSLSNIIYTQKLYT